MKIWLVGYGYGCMYIYMIGHITWVYLYIYIYTLGWNIDVEHQPFVDDFPGETTVFHIFLSVYPRVNQHFLLNHPDITMKSDEQSLFNVH